MYLADHGESDQRDDLDPAVNLEKIYVKFGADVLSFGVRNLPYSNFVAGMQNDNKIQPLNFATTSLLVNETKKIMGDESIRVSATTVRVPVVRGHSESVNVETKRKITADEVRALLSCAPGVVVVDNPAEKKYPLPLDAAGTDPTYVGRIREDESVANGINMWVVSDNLRKGAALNAVQIAELLISRK